MNENHRLISALNCYEFEKYFGICKRNSDTIKLYNNLNEFSDCAIIKLKCGKTIQLEKSNIKIDVNAVTRHRDEKIILYSFRKVKNKYNFNFFDIKTNTNLVLTLNKNNKIVNFKGGQF